MTGIKKWLFWISWEHLYYAQNRVNGLTITSEGPILLPIYFKFLHIYFSP